VNIDDSAAGRARPALPLAFKECPDAVLPDRRKIIEHAHSVPCPVPLVQQLQPSAREIVAGMEEAVLNLFAGRDGTAPAAFPIWRITAAAMVLLPQVGHADGAVHTAGGDER